MGKSNKDYVPDALQELAEELEEALRPENVPELRNLERFPHVDLKSLQKAVKGMPKAKREAVEKFCGLMGGINRIQRL